MKRCNVSQIQFCGFFFQKNQICQRSRAGFRIIHLNKFVLFLKLFLALQSPLPTTFSSRCEGISLDAITFTITYPLPLDYISWWTAAKFFLHSLEKKVWNQSHCALELCILCFNDWKFWNNTQTRWKQAIGIPMKFPINNSFCSLVRFLFICNFIHRTLKRFVKIQMLFDLIFNVFKRFRSVRFLGIVVGFWPIGCDRFNKHLLVWRRILHHDDTANCNIFDCLVSGSLGNTDDL